MDAMMIMMYSQLSNYVLLMGCGHLKAEKKSGANSRNYQLCWCELQPLKDLNPQFQIGTVKHIQIIQYVYYGCLQTIRYLWESVWQHEFAFANTMIVCPSFYQRRVLNTRLKRISGKLLFEDGEPLTFGDFMKGILTLRGSNQTTVKDARCIIKFLVL
jgi:hypothetical protein